MNQEQLRFLAVILFIMIGLIKHGVMQTMTNLKKINAHAPNAAIIQHPKDMIIV